MGDAMAGRSLQLPRFARQLAELHVATHNTPGVPDIPPLHERLMHKIRTVKDLPRTVQEASLHALAEMPQGDRLCHGDFHPLNVLLHQGRAAVIDWVDATRGNPLADVARTVVLMQGVESQAADTKARIEQLALRWFTYIYLCRYFHFAPAARPSIGVGGLSSPPGGDERGNSGAEWVVASACQA